MNLSSILDQINELKTVTQQDLNGVYPRALTYKKGQINSAKTRLENLYVDYKNELLKSSVFILVTGDRSDTFSSIAQEKFKCFSLDSKVMFKEILQKINPILYKNKKINSSIFQVIDNILEDKMKLLDVSSYNQLMFDTRYSKVVKDEKEMLDVIADAVSDIVGSEVVGLDALERISKEAIDKNYKSRIVPVLIHDTDEEFIAKISDGLKKINPKVVTVVAGNTVKNLTHKLKLEEIDEKSVEETLKTIAANA